MSTLAGRVNTTPRFVVAKGVEVVLIVVAEWKRSNGFAFPPTCDCPR